MFKPQRINDLLESRRITKVDFCEKIGISTVTLNRTIEHGAEIGCLKLERIADFFGLPIDYFFDREECRGDGNMIVSKKEVDNSSNNNTINGNGHTVHVTYCDRREIEHLKELLVEKERMIQLLMYQQNISVSTDKG